MLRNALETRMPPTWSIHYPWPLLAYHPRGRLTKAPTCERSINEVDDCGYDVVAEVLHVSPTAAVIDFGLRAFSELDSVPRGCRVGDYAVGRIDLSFPHYCYPSVTEQILDSMNHHWSIKRILADLTPYRPNDAGKLFIRDSHNPKYEKVKSTREKNSRSYALQCCLSDS